jgi:tetratricopeptide (TPR) repeat protein
MKKFEMEITLKDEFYQECGSIALPIPLSKEDMLEITRNNCVSMTVVADNLLQVIKTYPKLITVYRRLLVHSCVFAGGAASHEGNHELAIYYYLAAADFDPRNFKINQYLARNYQLMHLYKDAIDNYETVILHDDRYDADTWAILRVNYIACFYYLRKMEQVHDLLKKLKKEIGEVSNDATVVFGLRAAFMLSTDKAPEELQELFKSYFLS